MHFEGICGLKTELDYPFKDRSYAIFLHLFACKELFLA